MEKNSIEYLKNYLEVEIVKQEINKEIKEEEFNEINTKNFFKEGNYFVIKNKNTIVHIVKPNETLAIICEKYNKTEEEILLKNNITNIFIGQQLLI